jgi:hypothetical protein
MAGFFSRFYLARNFLVLSESGISFRKLRRVKINLFRLFCFAEETIKDSFSLRRLSCQLALIASFCYGVPASAVDWTITDLGTLGGTQSYAYGINARGQVVGGSTLDGTGNDTSTASCTMAQRCAL